MEFLGIGPLELVAILVIMLIVMGPEDMVRAGRTLGRFLRRIVTSEAWLQFRQITREVNTLPNKLMKEAGLEEIDRTLKEEGRALQQLGEVKQMEEDLAKGLGFDQMARALAFGERLAQGETATETDTAPETETETAAAPPEAAGSAAESETSSEAPASPSSSDEPDVPAPPSLPSSPSETP